MTSSSNNTKLSNLSVQWEWEGDKGIWQQHPIDIQQKISQAFDNGNSEVTVNQTEEIIMIIKFHDMVQINQKTKFMRRIRFCMELKDKNGFFTYEYENENKKWFSYNAEIMIKIANAIENDQTILSINYQNQSYDIDLDKLIETNLNTKAIRKIHCVKSMAKLPLNVSTISNKRSLDNNESVENNKKKRSISKSTPIEK
ncbi:unnamed protein product, partial [Rotaria sp. Silwood2]